jgi:hypothetical protein
MLASSRSPAIGWIRLQTHTLATVAHIVRERSPTHISRIRETTFPGRCLGERSHLSPAPKATYLSLPGVRGRARLLAGMVRANRPWQLVPSPATAIAAAVATAAFPIFYSSIWGMARSARYH